MLKHLKGFIALLLIGALLLGYILVFEQGEPGNPDASENIFNRKMKYFDHLKRFEVESGDFKTAFEKIEGEWFISMPLRYPADSTRVQNILDELNLTVPDRTINAAEVDNKRMKSYGLIEPRFTVTLFGEEDDPMTILLGIETPYPAKHIYAKLQGKDDVHVIPGGILDYLSKEIDDYRNRKPFGLLTVDTASLNLSGRWNATISRKSGKWMLEKPYKALLQTLEAEGICKKVFDIEVAAFVDDKPADFAAYGLENPSSVLTATDSKGREYTLYIGCKMVKKDAEDTPERYYAKTPDRNNILAIDASCLDDIPTQYFDAVEKSLTSLSYSDFKNIKVKTAVAGFEIAKDEIDLKITSHDDLEASGDAMEDFFKLLGDMKAEEVKPLGEDPVVYGLDGSNTIIVNSGKSGDTAGLKLEFGKLDTKAGGYYVRRDDETVVLFVPADAFKPVADVTRYNFFNREVNRFEADDAIFVSVFAEGNVLAFSKRAEKWICETKPSEKVDEAKLMKLLEEFERFEAIATFSRKVIEPVAGISDPKSKLVVKIKKKDGEGTKTETFSFFFGGSYKKDAKSGVYTGVNNDDYVFVTPDLVYQKLFDQFFVKKEDFETDKPKDNEPPKVGPPVPDESKP